MRFLSRRISVCVGGVLLIWITGLNAWSDLRASSATQDSNVEAQIEVIENAWTIALNDVDVDAMESILVDDFARPDPQGGTFIDKQEMLRYYRSPRFREGHRRINIADMRVSVYGDTAIARGHVHAQDSSGHVVSTLLFTDVFVRQKAQWRAVSAQENPVTH
jgi:ketosteroid isomerase-like protein